jgi:hypothetical protein
MSERRLELFEKPLRSKGLPNRQRFTECIAQILLNGDARRLHTVTPIGAWCRLRLCFRHMRECNLPLFLLASDRSFVQRLFLQSSERFGSPGLCPSIVRHFEQRLVEFNQGCRGVLSIQRCLTPHDASTQA